MTSRTRRVRPFDPKALSSARKQAGLSREDLAKRIAGPVSDPRDQKVWADLVAGFERGDYEGISILDLRARVIAQGLGVKPRELAA